MDALFPAAAFLAALAGSARSLGLGLGAAMAVGYLNGLIRANYLGVLTTFMFDAGVLGFYLGTYLFHRHRLRGAWGGVGGGFAVGLIAWPVVMTLVPLNDPLVQLVALRGAVWFLPVMVVASRLSGPDLTAVARVLAAANLVALAGGLYIYQNGVEAVYPKNAVTDIIYKSGDVAGFQYHRIPSTFLSAHAYGGTMLFTLPFLVGLGFGPGARWPDRVLAAAGIAAAAAGILLCAARTPVVMFLAAAVVGWAASGFNPRLGLAVALLAAAGLYVALSNERLQRAAELQDTEAVSSRVQGSANESFLELLGEYPLGAGMGSSVGTSIPFFLADRAPVQVGLENEYSRIVVDQGLVGLGLWLAFLGWLLARPPRPRPGDRWGLGVTLMYGLCLPTWATGFIGVGALTSIPQSVLLLTQMGLLLRTREPAPPGPAAARRGGRR